MDTDQELSEQTEETYVGYDPSSLYEGGRIDILENPEELKVLEEDSFSSEEPDSSEEPEVELEEARGSTGAAAGGAAGATAGGAAGGSAGAAIGGYFGGPIGAAIGKKIGEKYGAAIGQKLGSWFGSKAEDTASDAASSSRGGGGGGGCSGGTKVEEYKCSDGACHKSPCAPKHKLEIEKNEYPENWWDKLPDFDPRVYDAIMMEQAEACVRFIHCGLPEMHDLRHKIEARKFPKYCPRLTVCVPRTKILKPREIIYDTKIDDFIKKDVAY